MDNDQQIPMNSVLIRVRDTSSESGFKMIEIPLSALPPELREYNEIFITEYNEICFRDIPIEVKKERVQGLHEIIGRKNGLGATQGMINDLKKCWLA